LDGRVVFPQNINVTQNDGHLLLTLECYCNLLDASLYANLMDKIMHQVPF